MSSAPVLTAKETEEQGLALAEHLAKAVDAFVAAQAPRPVTHQTIGGAIAVLAQAVGLSHAAAVNEAAAAERAPKA